MIKCLPFELEHVSHPEKIHVNPPVCNSDEFFQASPNNMSAYMHNSIQQRGYSVDPELVYITLDDSYTLYGSKKLLFQVPMIYTQS